MDKKMKDSSFINHLLVRNGAEIKTIFLAREKRVEGCHWENSHSVPKNDESSLF
jgi:hypothetical protein